MNWAVSRRFGAINTNFAATVYVYTKTLAKHHESFGIVLSG